MFRQQPQDQLGDSGACHSLLLWVVLLSRHDGLRFLFTLVGVTTQTRSLRVWQRLQMVA